MLPPVEQPESPVISPVSRRGTKRKIGRSRSKSNQVSPCSDEDYTTGGSPCSKQRKVIDLTEEGDEDYGSESRGKGGIGKASSQRMNWSDKQQAYQAMKVGMSSRASAYGPPAMRKVRYSPVSEVKPMNDLVDTKRRSTERLGMNRLQEVESEEVRFLNSRRKRLHKRRKGGSSLPSQALVSKPSKHKRNRYDAISPGPMPIKKNRYDSLPKNSSYVDFVGDELLKVRDSSTVVRDRNVYEIKDSPPPPQRNFAPLPGREVVTTRGRKKQVVRNIHQRPHPKRNFAIVADGASAFDCGNKHRVLPRPVHQQNTPSSRLLVARGETRQPKRGRWSTLKGDVNSNNFLPAPTPPNRSYRGTIRGSAKKWFNKGRSTIFVTAKKWGDDGPPQKNHLADSGLQNPSRQKLRVQDPVLACFSTENVKPLVKVKKNLIQKGMNEALLRNSLRSSAEKSSNPLESVITDPVALLSTPKLPLWKKNLLLRKVKSKVHRVKGKGETISLTGITGKGQSRPNKHASSPKKSNNKEKETETVVPCTNCGYEVKLSNRFCTRCGAKRLISKPTIPNDSEKLLTSSLGNMSSNPQQQSQQNQWWGSFGKTAPQDEQHVTAKEDTPAVVTCRVCKQISEKRLNGYINISIRDFSNTSDLDMNARHICKICFDMAFTNHKWYMKHARSLQHKLQLSLRLTGDSLLDNKICKICGTLTSMDKAGWLVHLHGHEHKKAAESWCAEKLLNKEDLAVAYEKYKKEEQKEAEKLTENKTTALSSTIKENRAARNNTFTENTTTVDKLDEVPINWVSEKISDMGNCDECERLKETSTCNAYSRLSIKNWASSSSTTHSCTLCFGMEFKSHLLFMDHIRTDAHRLRLSLKLKQDPLLDENFCKICPKKKGSFRKMGNKHTWVVHLRGKIHQQAVDMCSDMILSENTLLDLVDKKKDQNQTGEGKSEVEVKNYNIQDQTDTLAVEKSVEDQKDEEDIQNSYVREDEWIINLESKPEEEDTEKEKPSDYGTSVGQVQESNGQSNFIEEEKPVKPSQKISFVTFLSGPQNCGSEIDMVGDSEKTGSGDIDDFGFLLGQVPDSERKVVQSSEGAS